MPYIQRDSDRQISAISLDPQEGFEEQLTDDDAELLQFLASMSPADSLARTDLEFVRVLEDLVEVLVAKNILLFTELPEKAQSKILARQALRRGEGALDLIDGDFRV